LSDEQIDEDPLMLLVRWSQIIGHAKRFNYCSRKVCDKNWYIEGLQDLVRLQNEYGTKGCAKNGARPKYDDEKTTSVFM